MAETSVICFSHSSELLCWSAHLT